MRHRIAEAADGGPDSGSVRPPSQPGRYLVPVWDLGDCYALPGDIVDGRVFLAGVDSAAAAVSLAVADGPGVDPHAGPAPGPVVGAGPGVTPGGAVC